MTHLLEKRRKAKQSGSFITTKPKNTPAPTEPWVTFIPGRSVPALDRKLRILSVTDRYTPPDIDLLEQFNDYLHLRINPTQGDVFYNGCITTEVFMGLHEWIMKDPSTSIIVHCGEGIMRSPAVAEFIARHYHYATYYMHQFCPRHTGNMDTGVYRTLAGMFKDVDKNLKVATH